MSSNKLTTMQAAYLTRANVCGLLDTDRESFLYEGPNIRIDVKTAYNIAFIFTNACIIQLVI